MGDGRWNNDHYIPPFPLPSRYERGKHLPGGRMIGQCIKHGKDCRLKSDKEFK